MIGLVGKKIGMTQILSPAGHFWPVTLVKFEKTVVKEVKTVAKGGYTAVQLATGSVRDKLVNKPTLGQFTALKQEVKRYIKEFRLNEDEITEYAVGSELGVDLFAEGEFVDVRAKSIGRGFAGVIKRWNMARGPETHGSMSHRQIGSIGASSDPSRVFKGHRMPGHYGNKQICVQNLLVVKVDIENQIVAIKGSVPGHDQTLLAVTKSFKRKKINIEEVYAIKQSAASKAKSKTAQKK